MVFGSESPWLVVVQQRLYHPRTVCTKFTVVYSERTANLAVFCVQREQGILIQMHA